MANLYYRTPLDHNGNCKRLEVDTERSVFLTGFRCKVYGRDYKEVAPKDFKIIVEVLKQIGFVEV